jgi:hypothetical protein
MFRAPFEKWKEIWEACIEHYTGFNPPVSMFSDEKFQYMESPLISFESVTKIESHRRTIETLTLELTQCAQITSMTAKCAGKSFDIGAQSLPYLREILCKQLVTRITAELVQAERLGVDISEPMTMMKAFLDEIKSEKAEVAATVVDNHSGSMQAQALLPASVPHLQQLSESEVDKYLADQYAPSYSIGQASASKG